MKYHTCWSLHNSVLDSLAEMFGPIIMRLRGQCGVQWRRKTSHVLDCHHVRVAWFQELIQHCKYLRVEHLEAAYAIHHPFQGLSLKIKCCRDKSVKYSHAGHAILDMQVLKLISMSEVQCIGCTLAGTAQFQVSGLIGTSHSYMQKIWIIGFFLWK